MTGPFPAAASPPTGRIRLVSFVMALLAASLLVVGAASPADAGAPEPSFPAISRGNRGEDVRAAQLLLREHGYWTPVTGFYDGDMVEDVRRFQTKVEVSVDGVIGPRTWTKLVVRAERADGGKHVLALQRLLRRKHGYDVAMDGTFGEQTEVSVVDFKDHMGLAPNGVVGRAAWRTLLWHYVHVRDDRRTCVLDSDAAWGTAATVGALRRAARSFRATENGGIGVGHLSAMHGGPLAPHVSHQEGMDADLRPVRDEGDQCSFGVSYQDEAYDRKGTRALIEALYEASRNKILVIWFNDPRLVREGLTEELSGHDDHLHVRWCVEWHPDDHYDCANMDWYRGPDTRSAPADDALAEDGTEDGLYGPYEEE